MKTCSTCKIEMPFSSFSKNRRTKDGYQNACRTCKHDYWNRWHQTNYTNPEYRDRLNTNQIKVALRRSLKQYGLSEDEYFKLVSQGCGICGGPPSGRGRYAFDHDHKTGKFRGLLCSRCNTAIGLMDDDIDRLANAIAYLRADAEIVE